MKPNLIKFKTIFIFVGLFQKYSLKKSISNQSVNHSIYNNL